MEIINILLPHILEAVGVIIGVVFYNLIKKYSKTIQRLSDNEVIRNIIEHTVEYVEQVFKDIHGKDKLNEAKTKIIKILNDKGIKLTDEEIEILIESAVKQMNDRENLMN